MEEIIQETDAEEDDKVLVLRKAVFLEELSKSSLDLLSEGSPTEHAAAQAGAKEDENAGALLSTPEKILCPCGKAVSHW